MKYLFLVVSLFVLCAATAQAAEETNVADYEEAIRAAVRFNETAVEVGAPEMDIPTYEEWLASKEVATLDRSGSDGSTIETKKDKMRRWLNAGIRDSEGAPATLADLQEARRQRLWAKSAQLLKAHQQEMEEAREWAKQHGFAESGRLPGGGVIGLVGIRNGIPKYNVTFNSGAADTISVDELWPGGSSGLSLSGTNLLLSIWDGGDVLTNHYEFTSGGAPSRALDQDGVSPLPVDPHPTGVAGTMCAAGVAYSGSPKGMSYQAQLWAYDWDDDLESEMNSAYANDVRVSNHSYGQQAGWGLITLSGPLVTNCWYGDIGISPSESHFFGRYEEDNTNTDALAYGNPYSLPVWSAGNERDDAAPPAGSWYVTWTNDTPVWDNGSRPNDYYQNGYDTISDHGIAKNVLTVGAVYKISGGYGGTSTVSLAPFSSCGPTDDGRIKPDVVAAGVDLTTPVRNPADPNNPYYYITSTGNTNSPSWATGTSFSSPTIAGAIGLLVELREQHEPDLPYWASTLKGILLHTCDEAQSAGPDYKTGWGLANAERAGELVQADYDDGGKQYIKEVLLNDGDDIEFPVESTGGVPMRVTIAWTDPAGPIQPEQLDPTNLVLVNDLDLRVISPSGATNTPWVLDPSNPGNAASTGDNYRDNIEQVYIASPSNGYYTVRVTHKGSLVDDVGQTNSQNVSIILSGIEPETRDDLRIAQYVAETSGELMGWPSVVGQNYRVQKTDDLKDQAWTNYTGEISATKTNITLETFSAPSAELRFYRLYKTN